MRFVASVAGYESHYDSIKRIIPLGDLFEARIERWLRHDPPARDENVAEIVCLAID